MGNEEWIDLVDADDSVIGKIPRSEAHAKGLRNSRCKFYFGKFARGDMDSGVHTG